MSASRSGQPIDLASRRDAQTLPPEVLQSTCARPGCNELFNRPIGPGRPALFHTEECRRLAGAELRKLQQRVRHHEAQLRILRDQVGAFSHADDDLVVQTSEPNELRAQAHDALVSARGSSKFIPRSDDPTVETFYGLLDGVAGFIERFDPSNSR